MSRIYRIQLITIVESELHIEEIKKKFIEIIKETTPKLIEKEIVAIVHTVIVKEGV